MKPQQPDVQFLEAQHNALKAFANAVHPTGEATYGGLELLDLFAVHAPPAPHGFQPVMPPLPTGEPVDLDRSTDREQLRAIQWPYVFAREQLLQRYPMRARVEAESAEAAKRMKEAAKLAAPEQEEPEQEKPEDTVRFEFGETGEAIEVDETTREEMDRVVADARADWEKHPGLYEAARSILYGGRSGRTIEGTCPTITVELTHRRDEVRVRVGDTEVYREARSNTGYCFVRCFNVGPWIEPVLKAAEEAERARREEADAKAKKRRNELYDGVLSRFLPLEAFEPAAAPVEGGAS